VNAYESHFLCRGKSHSFSWCLMLPFRRNCLAHPFFEGGRECVLHEIVQLPLHEIVRFPTCAKGEMMISFATNVA